MTKKFSYIDLLYVLATITVCRHIFLTRGSNLKCLKTTVRLYILRIIIGVVESRRNRQKKKKKKNT